jgi:uncharacterized Tic20 family protein
MTVPPMPTTAPPSLSKPTSVGWWAHLGPVLVVLASGLVPMPDELLGGLLGFAAFVPPLLALRAARDPFNRQHAVAALNFQLTQLLALLVGLGAFLTAVVLSTPLSVTDWLDDVDYWSTGEALMMLGFMALFAAQTVFVIVSICRQAARLRRGKAARYPLSLSFVR